MQQDHGRAIFRRSPQVSPKCSNHSLIFSGLLENSCHIFFLFTNLFSAGMNCCFGGEGEALEIRDFGDFVEDTWLTDCTMFSYSGYCFAATTRRMTASAAPTATVLTANATSEMISADVTRWSWCKRWLCCVDKLGNWVLALNMSG